jgi:hypothetical protein
MENVKGDMKKGRSDEDKKEEMKDHMGENE